MARIGEGQAFTSSDFKKAIYAIRGNNRQTKGMACAVAIEGQNEGSVLLVTDTWNGPESIAGCQLNRYSRKKQHFEDYQLRPSRITQHGHFSLVMCDVRDSSFKIKSLHKKCLNVQQLQRDFRVYTIYRDKCIDLELKYSNGGYNLIDNNLSDLTLCGSPVIDGDNSEKYLVGVLTTNTEGKAIPRFLSNGVLEQPVFNTHPTVLPTSREGVSINFSSDANGIPEPTFSWTKDGSAVTASDRVSLSVDNKELSIRNVNRTDSGEYRCVATNNVGTVYSNPATLAVHYQPEFTENPQSQTLVQGSSITFSSDANGVPEPRFSWTKNGSAVTANDRISLSADNKQLSITNVNRTDSGKYRCVATNNVETVNSNPATLTVQESWIENVITEGPGGYKRKAMAGEPASYSEEPMEVSGDLPGWYREEPMAGPSRKFREESTAEVQGKYRKKPMAEAPGKCSEEPTEKAPGGNIEQPISKEDNRSFNFIFEFRQEEPDKTVVELRCSGNGFTDSDWKDLSEKSVKQACMAVKEALEASGRRVAGVRPSESVVVELHCYTRQSFVSLMDDFESGKVKRRLEEEFEKVGYKGELEVTIINKSDVYRALDQIRAWMAMSKREGEISAAADANKIINVASSTTSYASTKETTNYARLCRLLLDVGSHALRNKFDSIHPPAGLHAVLTKPPAYPILQSLRRKRILNPTQWAKLYPPSPSSVSSKGFDVTLLILLLRNICGLTPPITGWHTLPPAADTSTEANIARVKYYRNHVYGNVSTGSVDNATFNTYWQDISNALVGLGADAAAINTLKTQSMDPVIEKHYQELLREWKKDDDSSKDRLDEIEEPLKRLQGERKIIESLTDLAGEAKQEKDVLQLDKLSIVSEPSVKSAYKGESVEGPKDDNSKDPREVPMASASGMRKIRAATMMFEAKHEECIRVLPYIKDGQIVVQFYVYSGESAVPKDLEEEAQQFFKEMNVKLEWSDLYNNNVNVLKVQRLEYSSEKPKTLTASQVDEMNDVIEKNLPELSKHRNITSVQASFKIKNSTQTDEPCITLYVLGKGFFPIGERKFPNALGGYHVDVVNGFWTRAGSSKYWKPNSAQKPNKILCSGVSIGVQGKEAAGTLGAIVKNGSTFYALSNDHVMTSEQSNLIVHPSLHDHLNCLRYYLANYRREVKDVTDLETQGSVNDLTTREALLSSFEELKVRKDIYVQSFSSECELFMELTEKAEEDFQRMKEPPREIGEWEVGVCGNFVWSDGKEYFIDAAIAKLFDKEVKNFKTKTARLIGNDGSPLGCSPVYKETIFNNRLCKSGRTTVYTEIENRIAGNKKNVETPHFMIDAPRYDLHDLPFFSKVMKEFACETCEKKQFIVTDSTEPLSCDECEENEATFRMRFWRYRVLCISQEEGRFAEHGDSGAVIFEIDQTKGDEKFLSGLGLFFAKGQNEYDRLYFASPLKIALDALTDKLPKGSNLELVSKF